MSSRLLIVDQSLEGFEGHHYEYSRAVVGAARAQGFRVGVACNRRFPGNSLAGAPVIGRFSVDWNAARRSVIRGLLRDVLTGLPGSVRRCFLTFGVLLPASAEHSEAPDLRFARELLTILAKENVKEADHVLIHTLGDAEFLGLAEVLARSLLSLPQLHVIFRYDGKKRYREAFEKLAQTRANLHYWTDSKLLATQYCSLGCPQIGVLPIPHGFDVIPELKHHQGAPLTLSCLGGARRDKGFHLLPDLVTALAAEYLSVGRARFVIQATYGVSRDEGLMLKAHRLLARFPREWVELIEMPPDTAAFAQALLSTDILVLPYDRATYVGRSSGILVQAIVAGIPTVVPEGTWLAAEAPEGAHVLFGDGETLVGAVRRAIDDHDALMRAARRGSLQSRERYDAGKLISFITS